MSCPLPICMEGAQLSCVSAILGGDTLLWLCWKSLWLAEVVWDSLQWDSFPACGRNLVWAWGSLTSQSLEGVWHIPVVVLGVQGPALTPRPPQQLQVH